MHAWYENASPPCEECCPTPGLSRHAEKNTSLDPNLRACCMRVCRLDPCDARGATRPLQAEAGLRGGCGKLLCITMY